MGIAYGYLGCGDMARGEDPRSPASRRPPGRNGRLDFSPSRPGHSPTTSRCVHHSMASRCTRPPAQAGSTLRVARRCCTTSCARRLPGSEWSSSPTPVERHASERPRLVLRLVVDHDLGSCTADERDEGLKAPLLRLEKAHLLTGIDVDLVEKRHVAARRTTDTGEVDPGAVLKRHTSARVFVGLGSLRDPHRSGKT